MGILIPYNIISRVRGKQSSSSWTPRNISLVVSDTGIIINWDSSLLTVETEIYVSIDGGADTLITTTGIGIKTYEYACSPEHTYSFKLRGKIDQTVLNAPNNLIAADTYDGVRITWDDNNTEAEYIRIYSNVNNAGYTLLTTVVVGTETYDNTPVAVGANVKYKMTAISGTLPVISNYSEVAEITVASVFDNDADALFARMIAAGDTPTTAQKIIYNTAFVTGKTKAFWNKLDCVWLPAGIAANSALFNIIANRNNLSLVGTPTFAANRGFTGSTNNCIRTNYKPNTNKVNWSLNSASFGYYARVNIAAGATMDMSGESAGGEGVFIKSQQTAGTAYGACNSSYYTSGAMRRDGMIQLSRTASNVLKLYREKNNEYTSNVASSAIPDIEIYLGARNIAGTISEYSTNQYALAYTGAGFDQTDVNDFYSVFVDGYLSSIGAKI